MKSITQLAGAIALIAGCATSRSSAGSFVTDVRVDGNKLAVERCRLDVEVVDRDVLRFLLFPLMPFTKDGAGLFTQRTPMVSRCATTSTQILAGVP